MENFVTGELVRLKSGGPLMTTAGDNYGEIICKWFDGNKPMRESFPPESLERAEKDSDEIFAVAI